MLHPTVHPPIYIATAFWELKDLVFEKGFGDPIGRFTVCLYAFLQTSVLDPNTQVNNLSSQIISLTILAQESRHLLLHSMPLIPIPITCKRSPDAHMMGAKETNISFIILGYMIHVALHHREGSKLNVSATCNCISGFKFSQHQPHGGLCKGQPTGIINLRAPRNVIMFCAND